MEMLKSETRVGLLYALKEFTEKVTSDIVLPVQMQEDDDETPKQRAAEVYLMRLPDMNRPTKKAPYILHQIVTGEDAFDNANRGTQQGVRYEMQSSATVRSVFCVYDEDEQEGALQLVNLMEELRIAFLSFPILAEKFTLDLKNGVNAIYYLENDERRTSPFYLGELITVWGLPPVTRLDAARVTNGYPARDPNVMHRAQQII